jgi:hypothetical protein
MRWSRLVQPLKPPSTPGHYSGWFTHAFAQIFSAFSVERRQFLPLCSFKLAFAGILA